MKRTMSWMMATMAMLGLSTGFALAGNTNAPAAPTDPASAMYTLNDIYIKLDNQSNTVTKRTGAFMDPSAGPSNTMHTLDEIMGLVTNRAPIIKGMLGSTVGVTAPNPRFVRQSDVVGQAGYSNIIDRLTGLMWTDNTSPNGSTNWNVQNTYCTSLHWGGYNSGWRIPSRGELLTIFGSTNNVSPATWASSANAYWAEKKYSTSCYSVATNGLWSDAVSGNITNGSYNCWPVRGGQ